MASDVQKFLRLKKKAADDNREADRAEGECATLLKQLKKNFGVKTLKAAKKLLAQKIEQRKEARGKFKEAFREWEAERRTQTPKKSKKANG